MATEISSAPRGKSPVQRDTPGSPNALNVLCALVVFLSFVPLCLIHAQRLWFFPHYQFFPFVLVGSAILAWSRWGDSGPLVRGDALPTFLGVLVSWLLLAAGEVVLSSTLGVVAGLLLLASLIYGLGGWALLRTQLPAWFFLWLVVPLPFGLDKRFVMSMQDVTSKSSSWVLDLIGVYHQMSGNVVEIAGNRLLVEEACAGVNSLFALVACCLFLVFFLRRPWMRAVLLVVATLGWVLVCNVIRVTLIALVQDRWKHDLATGWKHDALGFACFVLAVCLIWSTDRFFLFLKPHWTNDHDPMAKSATAAPFTSMLMGMARLVAWPAAIAFGVLLAGHFTLHGWGLSEDYHTGELLPTIAKIDRDSMPKTIAVRKSSLPWKFEQYNESTRNPGHYFGEFSKTWNYRRDTLTSMVSVDYPFPGYHDLKGCYLNTGWEIDKETEHRETKDAFWVEVKLKNAFKSGYLLFAIVDTKNQVLEIEATGVGATVRRYEKAIARVRNVFTKGVIEPEPPKAHGAAYQFQVFSESNAPFTDEEINALQGLFFESTRILRAKVFATP